MIFQSTWLVQTVVDRHARTSFVLTGWSVTIVAGVFLLAVRGGDSALAMAAGLLPALIFWGLDAFYLRQERMYRALYDHVRKSEPDPGDRFTLDARGFGTLVPSWITTLGVPLQPGSARSCTSGASNRAAAAILPNHAESR